MKKIIFKTISFEQGQSVLVDEHPVVNDKDYCEVVETSSVLKYEWNGYGSLIRGKTSKEELIARAIEQSKWDAWTEDNMYQGNVFADFGLDAPEVYDFEEDAIYSVNGIDDFINNCRFDDCYDEVIRQLKEIASKEYVVIIDG